MISISLLCSPHPKVALSINVLHAIHWIAQAWKEVEPETITKHFQKAEMLKRWTSDLLMTFILQQTLKVQKDWLNSFQSDHWSGLLFSRGVHKW